MAAFRTALRWIGWLALGLIVLAALVWIIARATLPSEAQRDAIAELERAPDFPGRNAFGLIWTLTRQVPFDEIDQVLAEDRKRIAEFSARPEAENFTGATFNSAAERYPELTVPEDERRLFCGGSEPVCLTRVAENADQLRALIERHAALLDRIEALSEFGHIDQPWLYSLSSFGFASVPGEAGLLATRYALWFVEGRQEQALAAICQGISTWRRLGRNSDSLIMRLTANSFAADRYGRLLAEMLAELPANAPLPAACDAALEPPAPDDLTLCQAMRGEFEISQEVKAWVNQADADWLTRIAWALFYDPEASEALDAATKAEHCSAAEVDRLQADLPLEDEPRTMDEMSPWRLSCAANLIGCTLYGIQAPAYDSYRLRMQDFGFKLKALATLAWLRDQHPGTAVSDELLSTRPQAMKSPTRALRTDAADDALIVPLYAEHGGNPDWRLPLPGSRIDATSLPAPVPGDPEMTRAQR